MKELFSIVVPALNEERAIAPLLEALRSLYPQSEYIVVDDGSIDATASIARKHGAIVIHHPANAGYGASLKDGIRAATHDTIAIIDADGSYPVDAIGMLVAKLHEGFDMVVGARRGAAYHETWLKIPARIVFKFLVEFTTGRSIPDINSGLRVFRKSQVLPHFPDLCSSFSFTTTITLIYMLTGKLVGYEEVEYGKRIGKSKVRIVRDSLRTLQYITEVIANYNPLKLFLLLSGILMLIALVSFVLAIVLPWGIPFVIFASTSFVGSFLIFGMGLLADVLRHKR